MKLFRVSKAQGVCACVRVCVCVCVAQVFFKNVCVCGCVCQCVQMAIVLELVNFVSPKMRGSKKREISFL